MNELCDYVALDLTHDKESAGIIQYYRNPKALEKLLREVNKARMIEVGKAAALEFEQRTETIQDYTMSVARSYQRNCLVSTLRPLLLMVQVDVSILEENQRMSFVRILAHLAKENQIDGVILKDQERQISEGDSAYL